MHLNSRNPCLAAVLWLSFAVSVPALEPFVLWTPGQPVPKAADVPMAAGVEIHTIAQAGPDVWMKGVHLGWHKGRLYASFGYNDKAKTQGENSPGEQARVCVSDDGGQTWSKMQTIAAGAGDMGISHGVFLSHGGRLWSFHGAFHGKIGKVHTRAFQLNEETGGWEALGTVVDGGFWPLQEPLKMDDGNWIMAGARIGDGNPAAVAISRGNDLTKWDLVVIPKAPGSMWGESSVLLDGKRILNIARYGSQAVALAARSEDYGRTWTPSRPSNLPMTTSRPFAGTLSTGQRYLICTTTADSGTRRQPLTIAVTQPGEMRFRRILGLYAPPASVSLNYPGAVERDGKLYVGFTERYTPKVVIVPVKSLTARDPVKIWGSGAIPAAAETPVLHGVEFRVIKPNEPDKDGYHWLHGVALAWHKGRLYASFGHNRGGENTASEEARGRVSRDSGRTWGDVFTIDPGSGNLGVSHGVFLSHEGRLWAFQGAFYDRFERTHTRAYVLDEQTGQWLAKGVVVDEGFWPMQEPRKMDDGHWIMAGARIAKGYDAMVGNLPAVAISHGDDLTQWDLVVIANDESVPVGPIWGESTVIVDGPRILNISRWGQPIALASVSSDFGRTWTAARASNLPMAASKPYSGVLSTGQRYLICTTTADAGNRRSPLTIAVSRPGEAAFSRVFRIRDAVHGGPGESDSRAALSYPYAVEHEGKLYVAYSNSGSRGGNRNSAELAIIPLSSMVSEPARPSAQAKRIGGGRIGAWSFEDLKDAVARDSAGNLNGRIQGTPQSVRGVVGRAIRLNGRTDFVAIPHGDELAFTEATFSICAWVNVYALDRGQQMIAAKNVYSAGQREWGLMLDHDNRFRFYLYPGGWQTIGSKTSPTPGRWHHLAVTMEAGYGRLYVNGRLEGEGSLGRAVPRTTAPVTFGGINDGGQLRQMLFGSLDEITLHRTVLTPGDVQTFANKDTVPHPVRESPRPYDLWAGRSLPGSADIPLLQGVRFQVIKCYEPRVDGYRFLHGVALAWHKGKLYASFGHNKGPENTGTEEARGRVSTDGGRTWGEVFTIDSGEGSLAVSSGVFLSDEGTLWAFQGAFYNVMEQIHTRAYVLDEATGQWQAKGVVVDGGFWPMQEPLKMESGNWIMSGFGGGLPSVAISHGDDLTRWDLVVIPKDSSVGTIWGESTVILEGTRVVNVSRYGEQAVALVAISEDYGRTWTPSRPSNLPMATSKPYTGTLSTGQHYLICTTTADSGSRRSPLTIAVTRPGETQFRRVFRIRGAEHEGPGESHPGAALAYPYALEHEGNLYVGYSNGGGGAGRQGAGRDLWNNNSAELAIIPVAALVGRESP